jgi:hypothetical protein
MLYLIIYLLVAAFWFIVGSIGATTCRRRYDKEDCAFIALLSPVWPVLITLIVCARTVLHFRDLYRKSLGS